MGYHVVHSAYVSCDCRTCNDDDPAITVRNKIEIDMENISNSNEQEYLEEILKDESWLVIDNNGDNIYFCTQCRIKLINDSIEGREDW